VGSKIPLSYIHRPKARTQTIYPFKVLSFTLQNSSKLETISSCLEILMIAASLIALALLSAQIAGE
jgi:hypothetical protein